MPGIHIICWNMDGLSWAISIKKMDFLSLSNSEVPIVSLLAVELWPPLPPP